VFSACLAGLVSGLVLTGIQMFGVLPIIVEAETYENSIGAPTLDQESSSQHHHYDPNAASDRYRLWWTALANVGIGIGFGLLLSAIYALRSPVTWAQGLAWGMGGYVTFFLAPAIGLPPGIPGDAVVALEARQLWWVLTVTCTGVGLLLLFLGPHWMFKVLGAVLLPVPHLIGAPYPDVYTGLAPEILANRFYLAAVIVNAIFWLVLGATSAVLFRRLAQKTVPES
jgi:cobalt transporter subunit CbtA